MQRLTFCVLAALLAALTLPVAAGELTAQTAFDKVKALAGQWQEAEAGEAGAQEVTYRVTSGGTVVMQTQFGGTDYEMISMYHLEGDELVLTHYCSQGNQPRLVLDPAVSNDHQLTFVFAGGGNLDPAKDTHIHGVQLSWDDAGKLTERWSGYANGEKGEDLVMELHRAE